MCSLSSLSFIQEKLQNEMAGIGNTEMKKYRIQERLQIEITRIKNTEIQNYKKDLTN